MLWFESCRAIEHLEQSVRINCMGECLQTGSGSGWGWMRCDLSRWCEAVFVVGRPRVRHLGRGDCIYCAFVDLERFF